MITTDAKQRKATPVFSGFIKYFPLAFQELALRMPATWTSPDNLAVLASRAGTKDGNGHDYSGILAMSALELLQRELEGGNSPKQRPFPIIQRYGLAIMEIAACSKAGNDQHNPGSPLHWDRSKSGDELDAMMRHLLQAGEIDSDGIRHTAKVAWRAMANYQKELEKKTEIEG